MLMSFLGAILPAWGYHLRSNFNEVGDYFLSLALGFCCRWARRIFCLPPRGLKFVLVLANALACGGVPFLALSSPPAPAVWRLFGVAVDRLQRRAAQRGRVSRHLSASTSSIAPPP